MAKDKRFVRVHKQSGFSADAEIWVDTITGVNYLFVSHSYGGGLTPLLDREGKPIISPLPVEEV